jgi:hypothetical protein
VPGTSTNSPTAAPSIDHGDRVVGARLIRRLHEDIEAVVVGDDGPQHAGDRRLDRLDHADRAALAIEGPHRDEPADRLGRVGLHPRDQSAARPGGDPDVARLAADRQGGAELGRPRDGAALAARARQTGEWSPGAAVRGDVGGPGEGALGAAREHRGDAPRGAWSSEYHHATVTRVRG